MGDDIVIGIDASRSRSGGATAHLIGLLENANPISHAIRQVHVWSYKGLLDRLPSAPWLIKHSSAALELSLLHQVWWQFRELPQELSKNDCNILLTTDASSVCRFRPALVMSRDMLAYEPGEMQRYGFSLDRLRNILRRYLQTRSLRSAHGVIFLTHYAADVIQQATGLIANYKVIPHGVGKAFKDVAESRRTSAINGQPIRCLYVSDVAPYKHQPQVVRAVANLLQRGYRLELWMVGGGDGSPRRQLEALISRIDPTGASIRLMARVPHGEIPGLLSAADVFIFASSCENMPNTLVEAMSSGLPIASSNRGPMPEVLKDGGIYFDPEDHLSISSALERIVTDPALRESVRTRAKRLAAEYSWNRCANETLAYLRANAATNGNGPIARPTSPVVRAAPREYQVCANCIMDTSDRNIRFDERGWCDYCTNYYNRIFPVWQPDERGEAVLRSIAAEIRKRGEGQQYDCILGVSGGPDSSYTAYIAKEKMGLRPMLFHVDAGWNSQQAVRNIERIVDGLGLDLYTEVIDWEEMKDLQLAFLRSQIPDQDYPQDMAFFSALYKFAAKHGVKYVLTGANFSTECCREPEEWGAYPGIDVTLVRDIHRRHGRRPLKSFPMVDVLQSKLYYAYILGMDVVKPLNYTRYVKAEAEAFLARRFGWEPFVHKHHESRFTRFYEDYWLPKKFGYDKRRAHLSSLIVTGQMTREAALRRIEKPEMDEAFWTHELEFIAKKLGLTLDELNELFKGENRTYHTYRNKRMLVGIGSTGLKWLGLERRLFR